MSSEERLEQLLGHLSPSDRFILDFELSCCWDRIEELESILKLAGQEAESAGCAIPSEGITALLNSPDVVLREKASLFVRLAEAQEEIKKLKKDVRLSEGECAYWCEETQEAWKENEELKLKVTDLERELAAALEEI